MLRYAGQNKPGWTFYYHSSNLALHSNGYIDLSKFTSHNYQEETAFRSWERKNRNNVIIWLIDLLFFNVSKFFHSRDDRQLTGEFNPDF